MPEDKGRIEQEARDLTERDLSEGIGSGDPASRRLPNRLDLSGRRGADSWIGWESALYLFIVGVTCVVLAPLMNLWWLVLLFGALVPLVLAVISRRGTSRIAPDKKSKEKELLTVLARGGEVTPATVALRISLTVDEASKLLEELVTNGHLNFRADAGTVVYSLRKQDRPELLDSEAISIESERKPEGSAGERLAEPLSSRELEVLTLLASGRTNAEIGRDLFVAVGTVKAHVNNIYRKLDAHSRAEALNRARELKLLN